MNNPYLLNYQKKNVKEFIETTLNSSAYKTNLQKMVHSIHVLSKEPFPYLIMLEITKRCNLACSHCINPGEKGKHKNELTFDEIKYIFDDIARHYHAPCICVGITGGEATVRKDLVKVVKHIVSLGFRVGVDSNAYNYGKNLNLVDQLVDAGMIAPTISIDGLEESHNFMRGKKCYKEAMKALTYISGNYSSKHPTVISVVSPRNIDEIPTVFDIFADLGIKRGRISPTMDGGRAMANRETILSNEQYQNIIEWLIHKRLEYERNVFPMSIGLIDDGWTGLKYEGVIRDDPVMCATGLSAVTIYHDGKIGACPHMNPELAIQGDLREESFDDVWTKKFELFRNKEWLKKGECKKCSQWDYCLGGAMHYRDVDGNMIKCPYLFLDQS